jgi:hypothetical protein
MFRRSSTAIDDDGTLRNACHARKRYDEELAIR